MKYFNIKTQNKTALAMIPIFLIGSFTFASTRNKVNFKGECRSEMSGKKGVYSTFDLELDTKNYHSNFMEFNMPEACGTYVKYDARTYMERNSRTGQLEVAFELRSKNILLNAAWAQDVTPGAKLTFRQSLPNDGAILCDGEVQ